MHKEESKLNCKIKLKGNLKEEADKLIKQSLDKKVKDCLIALKEATPVLTGKARDGWHKEGNTIVNEVEYIDILNDGTSKQAPEYFIEKTLLAQKGVIPSGTIVRSI